MQDRQHFRFIKSPILNYIEEALSACRGIDFGINTYPLKEYIFQSLFLRMTGAQEQKFKCLCWVLATDDYEYRYKRYSKDKTGECSSYSEKNGIYKDLIAQIKKIDPQFLVASINHQNLLTGLQTEYLSLLQDSCLAKWAEREYGNAAFRIRQVNANSFMSEGDLLSAVNNGFSLKDIYQEHLYRHRNRCAHNLVSYQDNLPSLRTLQNPGNEWNNYFIYFFILSMIDCEIRTLFDVYERKIETIV